MLLKKSDRRRIKISLNIPSLFIELKNSGVGLMEVVMTDISLSESFDEVAE